MKKDELLYGGASFTPSSVVNHSEEDFIDRHMTQVWRELEDGERRTELENVYKLSTEMVNAPDEAPAAQEKPVLELNAGDKKPEADQGPDLSKRNAKAKDNPPKGEDTDKL